MGEVRIGNVFQAVIPLRFSIPETESLRQKVGREIGKEMKKGEGRVREEGRRKQKREKKKREEVGRGRKKKE